ncbi:hypothetical protein KR222_011597 [Zaprionus bogoriensis]|nr:hypothetical protein KR222_011597 [Zaprionus bogoriensis]
MVLAGYVREGINVALIMGAGDLIAQLALERRSLDDWNVKRTLRYSALGFCVVAPAMRKWYGTLETLVPKEANSLRRGVKKMAIDQVLFAPPFTLLLSYLVPLINGESHNAIVDRLKRSYISIMKANYMLWPMAQMVNFSYVPVQYQVLYAQFIALIWNCYLSLMLNKRG